MNAPPGVQAWVDFNDLGLDPYHQRLHTLLKFTYGPIAEGDVVTVGDHEGNHGQARVERIYRGGLVELRLIEWTAV